MLHSRGLALPQEDAGQAEPQLGLHHLGGGGLQPQRELVLGGRSAGEACHVDLGRRQHRGAATGLLGAEEGTETG